MNSEPPLLVPPPVGPVPPVTALEEDSRRPWGFWLTFAFALCIGGTLVGAQTVVFLVFALVKGELNSPAALEELALNGLVVSVGICVAMPMVVGMCVLFAWLRRGLSVRKYLGLIPVSWKVLALAFVSILLYGVVYSVVSTLLGRPDVPESMLNIYRTAGFPPLLWFAVIVGAPVTEELLFRGFLFQGIEQSPVGGIGAILLTSLTWAMIHLQYDLFDIGVIFFMGLLLGGFRWRTGSILPALLMHFVNNLVCTIQVVYALR